jgi:hypothetical protein
VGGANARGSNRERQGEIDLNRVGQPCSCPANGTIQHHYFETRALGVPCFGLLGRLGVSVSDFPGGGGKFNVARRMRSGARWRDCPAEYGPYTTIYNRFNRWSRQGIWFEIFEALTGSTGIVGTVAMDSSHIKAHQSAAGGKEGLPPSHRPLAGRPNHQAPRADRRRRPPLGGPRRLRHTPGTRCVSAGRV